MSFLCLRTEQRFFFWIVAWYFRLARNACYSLQFRSFPPWPLLSDTAIARTLLVRKDLDITWSSRKKNPFFTESPFKHKSGRKNSRVCVLLAWHSHCPTAQIHFLTMNQSPFAPLFAFVYFENRPLTRASTGISQSRRKTLDWLFPDKLIEDKKASEHQQNGGNLRLFGRVGGSEILGNFSRA